MLPYRPEGRYASAPTLDALRRGVETGEVFQAMCFKCDENHDLHIDLGTCTGIIPRKEAALGIREGTTKEFAILSRVGKPVSFQVLGFDRTGTPVLSRRKAQEEAKSYFLSALRPGDVIPAVVQNCASFGVFCDIGCGFPALMQIDRCCVSRLQTGTDLFYIGQSIYAAIHSMDDRLGRVYLTGRELLGTWEENAKNFQPGQTVAGTVRSVMSYGIFVELAPNLSGLAESTPGIDVGDAVSVFIRAIHHDRHKIKLNILQVLPDKPPLRQMQYFVTAGHMEMWEYYPGSTAVTYF